MFSIACLIFFASPTPTGFSATNPCDAKPPHIFGGKYWRAQLKVECVQGQPTKFYYLTKGNQVFWEVELRNGLMHGKGKIYKCEKTDVECSLVSTVTYKDGILDGPITATNAKGATADFRMRDGVVDGDYKVKGVATSLFVTFKDGVIVKTHQGSASPTWWGHHGPPTFIRHQWATVLKLYREMFKYTFSAKSTTAATYDRYGFKTRDLREKTRFAYLSGILENKSPSSRNGIMTSYKYGRALSYHKIKEGITVASKSAFGDQKWEDVKPPTRKSGIKEPILVLGIGIGNHGNLNADVSLLGGATKRASGAGVGLTLGAVDVKNKIYSAALSAGAGVHGIMAYVSVGARKSEDLVAPDLSLGLGFYGVLLYGRFSTPGTPVGNAAEIGLTLKLPIARY